MTEQQKHLAETNHNLIYSFLQKYHLEFDEWYDMAAIGLCKAAITFNEDISCFSTYAYRCMFTAVFHENRRETQARTVPQHLILYYQTEFDVGHDGDVFDFLETMPSSDDVEGEVVAKLMYEEFSSELKPRDKAIFQMASEGYKQNEISKVVGCSQPQVSRVKKKLVKYLSD